MSSYALVVTTAPTENRTNTALQYASALVAAGHSITGIFFYQDGVLNGNKYIQTPSDEQNLLTAWAEFSAQTNTALHLCITAAERRGLTDSNDDQLTHNIHQAFTISGLGELVVLTANADKVVQL